MKDKLTFSTLPLLALFLALAPTALATTWYVNGKSGSNRNNCLSPSTACKTIGHTISLASSGDTVMVAPAGYTERLTISVSLKIVGSGAKTTIVDGNHAGTVFTISSATANVTLSNFTIRYGLAGHGGGGGVYNIGTLTISDSSISGNGATVGGGVYNGGKLLISDSSISGNGALYGGSIANAGILTIDNSTLSESQVTGRCSWILKRWVCIGGLGAAVVNGGTLTINNSTISGNTAFVQNFLPGGSGIYNGGQVQLQNSIIANNREVGNLGDQTSNCYGSATSHGYNMSDDSSCSLHNSGDRNNTNPLLGPLHYNGGPTQTMALGPGSPAIDAGNPSGCTDGKGHLLKTDQRGYPRPNKEDTGGCDMGAYESQTD